MTAEVQFAEPVRTPGRRPKNPIVTARAIETVESVTSDAGYWPAAKLAAALGWHVEELQRMAERNVRLRRLKRRADAAAAARLAEVVTERGLAGDASKAMAVLKNEFDWKPGRDVGGAKLSEPQRQGLALFSDLEADAE